MSDRPDRVPARLKPFLAQWDYIAETLFDRMVGLTDDEYLWEPAEEVWTVRLVDGRRSPAGGWTPGAPALPG